MNIKGAFTILLLGVLPVGVSAQAGPDASSTKLLKGLPPVIVAIDEVMTLSCADNLSTDSLTHAQVRGQLEQQLRKAGIKVVQSENGSENDGTPWLHFSLVTLKDGHGAYNYSIRLELMQEVVMRRKPHIKIIATTWKNFARGNGAGYKFLEGKICEVGASFIWAYQDANSIGTNKQPWLDRMKAVQNSLCGPD